MIDASLPASPRPYGEGGDIPSPCTGHCRIDASTGCCEGCLRTPEEIGAWWRASDEERSVILRRLGDRRDALVPRKP